MALPIIYVAWLTALYFFQTSLLFPASMAGRGLPTPPQGVEVRWMTPQSDVRTEVWVVPAWWEWGVKKIQETKAQPESKGYVVFLHGNAELIDDCIGDAQEWAQRGYTVILPEYRGYGRSSGRPGQDALVADVLATIQQVVPSPQPGESPPTVIVHGRSVGTGVAVQVAARAPQPLTLLVLESPFKSVAGFSWGYGAPEFIVSNPFRSEDLIGSFDFPILVLAGKEDTIVPPQHGKHLASLNPRATLIMLPGGHNSGLSAQGEYWRAVDVVLGQPGDAPAK